VLRAHADDQLLPVHAFERRREGALAPVDGEPLPVAERHPRPVRFGGYAAQEEVHRGAADEAGDEEVRRRVVELLRRGDLL
jgi:hypothetical protein